MLIDVDDGWGDRATRLQRFRSRRAELDRIDFSVLAVRGEGVPAAPGRSPRWGVECGYDEVRPVGLGSAGRRRSGRPRCLGDQPRSRGWTAMGREITEQTIPAELGSLLDVAASFTKGCYPGQELVERMHSLARRRSRLVRRLEATGGRCGPARR